MPSLVYAGPRSHVMAYLDGKGWTVTGIPGGELFRRNGLTPTDREGYDPLGEIAYGATTLWIVDAAQVVSIRHRTPAAV